VTVVVLAVVAVGILIAYRMYGTRAVPAEAPAGSALTVAARRDLYGDAFNERVLMAPGAQLTRGLTELDDEAVDGAASGLAAGIGRLSGRLRQVQTGFARSYALSMLAGATFVVALILAVNLW
jgi:NADH-quinone oxidoreductase subunit L